MEDVAFELIDAATDTVKKQAVQIRELRSVVKTLWHSITHGYNYASKERLCVEMQRAQAKIKEQTAEIEELKKENKDFRGDHGGDFMEVKVGLELVMYITGS